MAEKPAPEDQAPDADKRFQETLRNLVNTPHKPHVEKNAKQCRGTPKAKSDD